MSQRPKAVILDWGGVLIEDPAPGLMQGCAEALGVSMSDYRAVHLCYGDAFQTGRLCEDEFWRAVCHDLDVSLPDEGSLWGRIFRRIYRERPGVLAALGRLRQQGIGTALLSNTEIPVVAYFEELNYDVFDVAVFSCVEGVAKPHARIYERVLERLEIQPERGLFIDDRREFVVGAQSLGLEAIQCATEKQVLCVLHERFL